MAVDKTYTIEDVWIVLTYPDSEEENFKLEAPNGDNAFEFGFRKIPKLEDYRDANMKWQRGCYYYQLFVRYQYQSHDMDLRKLLVADNIALKFPPAFGQQENYNQADCLLANESVVKNYIAGLAMGGDSGEVIPSGDLTLEFEGIDAFTEAQLFSLFGWNQSDVADPDDEDPGTPDPETEFEDDIFYVTGRAPGESYARIAKFRWDEGVGLTMVANHDFEGGNSEFYDYIDKRNCLILSNGHVLAWSNPVSTGNVGVVQLHLFDSDLNPLTSVYINEGETSSSNPGHFSVRRGHDDTIYVAHGDGSLDFGDGGYAWMAVTKFDKTLTKIWKSDQIEFRHSFGGTHLPHDRIVMPMGNVVFVKAQTSSTPGSRKVAFIDDETGSVNSEVTITKSEYMNTGAILMKDKKVGLFYVDDGAPENDALYVWNADGSFYGSTLLSGLAGDTYLGMSASGGADALPQVYQDGRLLVPGNKVTDTSGNPVYIIDRDAGTIEYFIEGLSGHDFEIVNYRLLEKWMISDDETVRFYDASGVLEDGFGVQSAVLEQARRPKMKYDNPEIDWFVDPGTPDPPPVTEYQGSVQVTSAADANFPGTAPETYILIRNSPSTASDECGTGGTEFNIEYKLTDYCMVLPVASPSNLALQIAQFIDANIPGLNAYNGTGYDGAPAVFMQSETLGMDDEGEGIIFGVPSVLEQDGPVFNRYTVYLSGAEEASTIDEPINIRLGKTVFATTENITGSESKESIAQKIYDACVAVDQDDVEFSKSGETITVTATGFKLAISLDIGGTGFDYIITDMTEI